MKLSSLPFIALAMSAVSLTLYFTGVHPLVSLSVGSFTTALILVGAFLLGIAYALADRAQRRRNQN